MENTTENVPQYFVTLRDDYEKLLKSHVDVCLEVEELVMLAKDLERTSIRMSSQITRLNAILQHQSL